MIYPNISQPILEGICRVLADTNEGITGSEIGLYLSQLQEGFKNILCGLMGMFRNPEAHELKVEWPINEQDALEIFGMISYCHRRLDKAQKIRME